MEKRFVGLDCAATRHVDFATAALQNSFCVTQELCHTMILFHNCLIRKDESNKKNVMFSVVVE
jgi:hypothetical protein